MSITSTMDGYTTCLPREYYLDEGIFQEELRKVFAKQWLLVGHVSQIRTSGQYYVKQVGTESMIIARDREGRVWSSRILRSWRDFRRNDR